MGRSTFTLKICKLCHTELKDNFKEDTAMLQISEIVKKTEEMFDLFNLSALHRLEIYIISVCF